MSKSTIQDIYVDADKRFHLFFIETTGDSVDTVLVAPMIVISQNPLIEVPNLTQKEYRVYLNGTELGPQDFALTTWDDASTYKITLQLINRQFQPGDYVVIIEGTKLTYDDIQFTENSRISAAKLNQIFDKIMARMEELQAAGFSFASATVFRKVADAIHNILSGFTDSAKTEIDNYVATVSKPDLDNYIATVSKPDLDNYIATVSKPDLDSHTAAKKTELDNYITTTSKPEIDSYVDTVAKPNLDNYVNTVNKPDLDNYTNQKKTDIDNYVATTSKPDLDTYTNAKKSEIDNEANLQILNVQTEGNTQVNRVKTEGDTQVQRVLDTYQSGDADTVDGKHAADLANVDLSNVDDNVVLTKATNVVTLPPLLPHDSVLYFKDSLVDKVQGLKPEGYDGSSITSSGLRTNGTILVVTERTDDRIHPGVKSIAVEEGTTNHFTANGGVNLLTISSRYEVVLPSWYQLTGETWLGTTPLRVDMGSGGIRAFIQTDMPTDTTNGTTYTFSIYVRPITGTRVLRLTTDEGQGPEIVCPAGQWTRLLLTFTTTATIRWLKIEGWQEFDRIDFAAPQLEIKPFASSFVVDSRPSGRLVIPVEDLKFDIANDDWVISYWKYPVATSDGTQNNYNVCSLGQYTSDNSKGYIWWGKESGINGYRLNVILNDATGIQNISANTFNPTDYFYHWHFEVMKKQGKVLSYYVDGVKQCELIIPVDKEIQIPFDVGLSLGGSSGSYPNNALIANLLIARYDPNIWTDVYIQYIDRTQSPFYI